MRCYSGEKVSFGNVSTEGAPWKQRRINFGRKVEKKWRRRQLVRPVAASSQSAGDVQTPWTRLKVIWSAPWSAP